MPRPVSYDYNKRTGILSGAQRKREGESNLANQEQKSICREIGARTGGDIYIGVVGPVRSGKSTFIKRFMEQLVLPAIGPAAARERARDELPQSAAGRTIMTTEPKFIPETAVPLQLEGGGECRVRLIDCVGYMVEGAMGHEENDKPRMVKSPWFDHEVPFDLAAETGTRKVICEHSTIGIVVTTDGSVSDIPREGYARTEKRIVEELDALGKPYIILLNSTHPDAPETKQLAEGMARDYDCLLYTSDQRVVFQLLVQPAAQAQHSAVHHRANAAHALHIACALHLAQCIADDGAAHAQLSGKIYLGGQTVGPGIAPGAQLFQQTGNDAVADHSTAQSVGRGKCRFLHGSVPPFTGRGCSPPGLEACAARHLCDHAIRRRPLYTLL